MAECGQEKHSLRKKPKVNTSGAIAIHEALILKELNKRTDSQAEFIIYQIGINAPICIWKGYQHLRLTPPRILKTNADCNKNFTSATCLTECMKDDVGVVSFPFGYFFKEGFQVLEAVSKGLLPVDNKCREAIGKLMLFLQKDHSVLYNQPESEGKFATILAQHLFGPLSPTGKYTIDDKHQDLIRNFEKCPCNEKDRIIGELGNTSYGCIGGWYGRADILFDDLLSVHLCPLEESSDNDFMIEDIEQLLAKTITFSFLQHSKHPCETKNSLIPTIGISTNQITVCFYDSVNDVLLMTPPLNLFINSSLNMVTSIVLWLTLNYEIFGSGVQDRYLKYKSGFPESIGDFIENYQTGVIKPFGKPHNFNKLETDWAEKIGGEEEEPRFIEENFFSVNENVP